MQCGTIKLPVDWSRPGGPTFDLALARRAATGVSKGPLFINPGGPGGSGVSMALQAPARFSPVLLQNFDIIGFDPRGVARSHPVVCTAAAMNRPGNRVLPTSEAQFAELVAFNRQLAADCRRETGPLFDHVDSRSVARDVDAVRAALGAPKLNWYGASYGTLMGQMYAELFPGRIRAMVNDGNMDHSLGIDRFIRSDSAFAEDSFEQFVAWCNQSANCKLHGQNVKAIFADLLRRADEGKLLDPADGTLISNWDLLDVTQFYFNRPRWVELGKLLATLNTGVPVANANATQWSRALATTRAADAPKAAATKAAVTKAGVASSKSAELVEDVRPQFCQDWAVPISTYAELNQVYQAALKAAPNMRASVIALASSTQCIGRPGKVNNPQHPLRVIGAPKILMLNGLHDPATGYAWALNVKRQLGSTAVLVTYEGAGHVAYTRNTCTRAAVDNYLVHLITPPDGTRCPATNPALTTTRTTTNPELTTRW
ncbi:alpha/beta hydrolase [Kribbella deserti]|uniref:Alpha/beta hydrolase n=1 Tax=Kribbella deserti TaxID=1926257 RepID=A0ABV6QQR9_9ACTN